MLRRCIGPALVVAGALLLVPGQARANHHAIGGPKSPLISGVNQSVPIYLPQIQTPLLPDLGQWGDIITPPYSDPLNDAGPDLSCLKPNLGTPQGGDPPIPSVCAPTLVKSDGKQVYLSVDANIKTQGSVFEVVTQLQLLLSGLL